VSDVNTYNDYQSMILRVKELERKIEHLRISRRVLMNLVERMEREKIGVLTRLEYENRKLQRNNSKYARALLAKNCQILELASRITDNG